MQKLYTWSELGEPRDTNMVSRKIDEVEAAFEAIGLPVDLRGYLTPPEHTTVGEMGLLVTPDLPENLEKALEVIDWLSVGEEVAETFEKDITGSRELTNIVARNDLETEEVVKMLAETEYSDDDDTNMIRKLIDLIRLVAPSMDARRVAAYDIFRKSLGWESERLLIRSDDFWKALASKDDIDGREGWSDEREKKGIDLGVTDSAPWDMDDAQLKTMQRVTSKKLHNEEHEIPHLSYAWTSEGILVADMDERSGSDGQAGAVAEDLGTTKTVVKKSLQSGTTDDLGRPARVLARE